MDPTPPDDASASAAPAARPAKKQTTPWPEGTQFGRADKICAWLLGLTMVFGLVMLPLRPVVLGLAPLVLVALTGSRTGMVACGALAATGQPWLAPVALVVGVLSIVKFDPVYWWAGRLWGDWFIASMVGPSKGAQKRAKRAERLTRKYDILAIAVTFVPFVPIPRSIVLAVLGTSGTTLRRFLAIDLACAVVLQSLWLYLGWRIGQPAVYLLDEFAKYSWYVTGAIVLFIVVAAVRGARTEEREKAARASGRPADAPAADPDRG